MFLLICYCVLEGAAVVGIRDAVGLDEGDVAGSKVTDAVVSIVAGLHLTLVEETSAECCVAVDDVLAIKVVEAVLTWERHDVCVMLMYSAATCIIHVNYGNRGTSGLFLLSRMLK